MAIVFSLEIERGIFLGNGGQWRSGEVARGGWRLCREREEISVTELIIITVT
jgi:hypothetical protein